MTVTVTLITMAFSARLNAASAEAKSEFRQLSDSKDAADSHRNDMAAGDIENDESKRCLEAVSEYLFDLFDANCMDEYKRLDAIDQEAMDSFDGHGVCPSPSETSNDVISLI